MFSTHDGTKYFSNSYNKAAQKATCGIMTYAISNKKWY